MPVSGTIYLVFISNFLLELTTLLLRRVSNDSFDKDGTANQIDLLIYCSSFSHGWQTNTVIKANNNGHLKGYVSNMFLMACILFFEGPSLLKGLVK